MYVRFTNGMEACVPNLYFRKIFECENGFEGRFLVRRVYAFKGDDGRHSSEGFCRHSDRKTKICNFPEENASF